MSTIITINNTTSRIVIIEEKWAYEEEKKKQFSLYNIHIHNIIERMNIMIWLDLIQSVCVLL